MFNTNNCEWLLETADTPIRYRVFREILKDMKSVRKIESELINHPVVEMWLKLLNPNNSVRKAENLIHGSPNEYIENAMLKIVQLGLNADTPIVADAIESYIDIIENYSLEKPLRKQSYDIIILANILTIGSVKNEKLLNLMFDNLDEMYTFALKGDCNIYLNEEERAMLKGVPKIWSECLHFTRPDLFDNFGMCWPLLYDIFGLTKLYGAYGTETDKKIDTIMKFIANDEFHYTIADWYGILINTMSRTRYYGHGWDPKFPGWFDVTDYIKTKSVPKLLFFAMYISKFPIALKTKWFSDLLHCLEKYKTEKGTFKFPKEWLIEARGNAVMGSHMSFGENRRKSNWDEIESTFYMQLIYQNIE